MVLHDWHVSARAEFQPHGEFEIVSTYGALPLEYAAIFRSAAMMDMPHRGALRISGPDRFTFLNSILTAEIVDREGRQSLADGETRFAFLLDRKGRIQAEMNVVSTQDHCLLEMDRKLIDPVARELEKYHFREKVDITSVDACEIALFGPKAGDLLRASGILPAVETTSNKQQATLWRDDLAGIPCYHILLANASAAEAWRILVDAPGTVPVGWAAYNTLRIEASRPLLGIDYDNTFVPAETGQLERAVSFTKGCYPGQEIVARMRSHDQVARRVVQLRMGPELPLAGQPVLDASNTQIGAITSSTISPRQSSISLCLAIVKRPHFEPGTRLRVPAEGAMRDAIVL